MSGSGSTPSPVLVSFQFNIVALGLLPPNDNNILHTNEILRLHFYKLFLSFSLSWSLYCFHLRTSSSTLFTLVLHLPLFHRYLKIHVPIHSTALFRPTRAASSNCTSNPHLKCVAGSYRIAAKRLDLEINHRTLPGAFKLNRSCRTRSGWRLTISRASVSTN